MFVVYLFVEPFRLERAEEVEEYEVELYLRTLQRILCFPEHILHTPTEHVT